MKHVFIINPQAGNHDAYQETYLAISPFMDKFNIEIYKTDHSKDATEFVDKYAKKHIDEEVRFYACGGDGTLNEVVNGAINNKNASVSVFPCGSGNDFIKSFKNPEKFLNIENLLNSTNESIDVLLVNDSLYCVNVCNFGFDALVAKTANDLKLKGKKNAYTKGIFKALLHGLKNKVTVEADNKVLNPTGKMLLTSVANGAYYGGKYKCAPLFNVKDGLIEVCLINTTNVFNFLRLIKQYERGLHINNPKFKKLTVYTRAKSVKMYSKNNFYISLDGEIIENKNFTVKILKQALKFGIPT